MLVLLRIEVVKRGVEVYWGEAEVGVEGEVVVVVVEEEDGVEEDEDEDEAAAVMAAV